MNVNFLSEISNFIFTNKYARFNEFLGRRETWEECIDRVMSMHLSKFKKKLSKEDLSEIKWAFDQVKQKNVVPSMRSMQFGGKAIEAHNSRIFNCSVRHIDSIRSFAESFYLLLCGCGVGFGLTNYFLNRLPDLVNASNKTGIVVTYVVEDSIEGWSDSIEALLNCYFKNTAYTGRKIVFDYSKIRPEGAPLKTGGGKAPGYKGLKNCHKKVKELLDHIIEDLHQTRIKTINAYDILMHIADAVLSGGIRRSACSVVFNFDDIDMMESKTYFIVSKHNKFSLDEETKLYSGKITVDKKQYEVSISEYEYNQVINDKKISWFHIAPQRARSNNSVLLIRNKCTKEQFELIINKTKQFGEPGFVFADNEMALFNPCFTIDTKILTSSGWKTFSELLNSKEDIYIHQDNRVTGHLLNNNEYWDLDLNAFGTSKNIATKIAKTGDNKEVFEVLLSCGRNVKATGDHHLATTRGMVQIKDLVVGTDKVLIGTPIIDDSSFEKNQDFINGFISGLVLGDGYIDSKNAAISIWIDEDSEESEILMKTIETHVSNILRIANSNGILKSDGSKPLTLIPKFKLQSQVGRKIKYSLICKGLKQALASFDIINKDDISLIHNKSKNFKAGFVSGMIFTDGHIDYNENSRSVSVRITQSNKQVLIDIMLILQELGIFSKVYNLLPEGNRMFLDSNREEKEYHFKESFRLVIPGIKQGNVCLKLLYLSTEKYNKLNKILIEATKITNIKFESRVISINYIGKEDVYCLEENNRRTLIANGITARRCFEISFEPINNQGLTGVQFCNLTSVNGAKVTSLEKFLDAVKAATILGTLQASYTDKLNYLTNTSKELTDEEALLGVSITGMMDNPDILLNPANQRRAAKYAIEINKEWSAKISINPAARITCIKPEGTSSLVLESASGIHPHHARRYFRRVQCNKIDPVYKFFKKHNPHMCEESVWSANKTDDIICFPLKINENAIIKEHLSALQHLEVIKLTQENWVENGTTDVNKKGIKHNVSCTVLVGEEEWDEVINYLYQNREYFCAVSLLPKTGDKLYVQAPLESITTKEDEEKWNNIINNYKPVNYKELTEEEDTTKLQETAACAGGKCELF